MSGDFKKKLKDFTKDLKQFKKVAKKDTAKASLLAEELISRLKLFMKEKYFLTNEKELDELSRVQNILKLYVTNIKALGDINGDKKK